MPSVTWHVQDGAAETEEGKVAVLAKLFFVNGAKKRKLSELSSLPERVGRDQIILRFGESWCVIKFDGKKASDDFERSVLQAVGKPNASSGSSSLADKLEDDVRSAIAQAGQQPFKSPLPEDFKVAGKTEQVTQLVVDMCRAWENADARQERTHKERLSTLEAQKDEAQRIRAKLEDENRQADGKLRDAQTTIAAMSKTAEFLNREISALRKTAAEAERADPKRLRFLEEEVAALRQRLKGTFEKPTFERPPPSKKPRREAQEAGAEATPTNMAKAIAESEAQPLLKCPAEDRPALKKKLLLKWHPDKQPSPAHADLSKRVMQELQNTSGWDT